jgi:hypothetical protein
MAGTNISAEGFRSYDESEAEKTRWRFDQGWQVMRRFLGQESDHETPL